MSDPRANRTRDVPVSQRPRASRIRGIAIAIMGLIGFAVLVGGLWLASPDSEPIAQPLDVDAESVARTTRGAEPPTQAVVSGGKVDSVLAPSRTLVVVAGDLVPGAPLSIQLGLPVRQQGNGEPLRVRLLGEDREPYVTEARLIGDEEGMHARLDIPPDWLTPGVMLIEVTVRENSPLPLRRYVLRVR